MSLSQPVAPTLTISHPHRLDTADVAPAPARMHIIIAMGFAFAFAELGSEQKQQDSLKAEEGNRATYKRVFALSFVVGGRCHIFLIGPESHIIRLDGSGKHGLGL